MDHNQITTVEDLSFTLLTINPGDTVCMSEFMFHTKSPDIEARAKELGCTYEYGTIPAKYVTGEKIIKVSFK